MSTSNRLVPPVPEQGGEEAARRKAAELQKPSTSPTAQATDDVASEHALKKRVAIAAENVQDTNVSIPIIPKNNATLQLLGEHLTAIPKPFWNAYAASRELKGPCCDSLVLLQSSFPVVGLSNTWRW